MSVLVIGAGAYGLALSNSIKGEVYVYSSLTNKPKNSPTSSSSGMNLDLLI